MIGCQCEVCLSIDKRDKRLRSSILIEHNGKNTVVDTGPDFRYQMLREKVTHLEAVLFTHEHKDHVAGMDDVRAFNYLSKQAMQVYATERVQTALKREFYYAFEAQKYPGVPQIDLKTIDASPFCIGDLEVTPIEMLHYKLPVLGFRFGKFAYLTDANYIAPEELKKLEGVEVMVINALREQQHISHFSLEEALDIIKQINPKQAYLTHFSHQMGKYVDVVKKLPANVLPAVDQLVLEIE
jgi:phosphoribosyl 1,2-cyclic phosphate phosphodiesterase